MEYKNDPLTELIIKCIIAVHHRLGSGYLEKIYRNALLIELRNHEIPVELEKEIIIYYHDQEVGRHRLDIVVDGCVVIECKTVEKLGGIHYAQIKSYLKATKIETGILVNFNAVKADYRRIDFKRK